MLNNPSIPTAEQAMKTAYQNYVHNAGQSGTRSKDAIAFAADEVRQLIESGEVQEPDMFGALRSIGYKVDESEGSAADKIIKLLNRGQDELDLDLSEILMTVVTLGKGERKSWEYVTPEDLQEMDLVRRENVTRVLDAYREWETDYIGLSSKIAPFGTVGNAYRHGALVAEEGAA